MASLIPELKSYLKRRCITEGFEKKVGQWFYREGVSNDFQDLLTFSFATYHGGRSVRPFIGIRHLPIEQLFQELTGNKLSTPYWLLSLNIGHIDPSGHFKDWYFKESSTIPGICDEMFLEIQQYGYPFYKEYEDIARLIDMYEHKRMVGLDNGLRFINLPLLYLYSGQQRKGVDFMDAIQRNGYRLDGFKQSFYSNYCHYEYGR